MLFLRPSNDGAGDEYRLHGVGQFSKPCHRATGPLGCCEAGFEAKACREQGQCPGEFIRFGEHDLAVVYRRMPNRIGLGDIFALPEEAHLFEERMRGASKEEL